MKGNSCLLWAGGEPSRTSLCPTLCRSSTDSPQQPARQLVRKRTGPHSHRLREPTRTRGTTPRGPPRSPAAPSGTRGRCSNWDPARPASPPRMTRCQVGKSTAVGWRGKGSVCVAGVAAPGDMPVQALRLVRSPVRPVSSSHLVAEQVPITAFDRWPCNRTQAGRGWCAGQVGPGESSPSQTSPSRRALRPLFPPTPTPRRKACWKAPGGLRGADTARGQRAWRVWLRGESVGLRTELQV